MQPLLTELACLGLTQCVELALVCVLASRAERVQLVLVFLYANTLTQPIATLVQGSAGFVTTESAVVVAETALVAVCSTRTWSRAFALALGVNAASAALSF